MKTMTKKRAFTLIELLIVIAIIGILFIVLVSKVDFATDKAKATGVQTDFRSFQMAFDTVAKENAGFNTFGWDTGDANQDGIRNSYDEGDNGAGGGIAQNGIQDGTEVFTGHKVYAETFNKVFSLKKNGTGSYDRDALNRLESAINANLDPKLHITIKDDGEILMANGAQDPWNKEYHGWYISNAEVDGKDRGAIVMYSDGANNEFGSEHKIANGVVTVSIPGNNKFGKDDYSIVSVYTYLNGYGEVKNITTGFSNNQTMLGGNSNNNTNDNVTETPEDEPEETVVPGGYDVNDELVISYDDLVSNYGLKIDYNFGYGAYNSNAAHLNYILTNNQEFSSVVKFVLPDNITNIGNFAMQGCPIKEVVFGKNIEIINTYAFYGNTNIETVILNDGLIEIKQDAFATCTNLKSINLPDTLTTLGSGVFGSCASLVNIAVPDSVTNMGGSVFSACYALETIRLGNGINKVPSNTFNSCTKLKEVVLPQNCQSIDANAFSYCSQLTTINIPGAVTSVGANAFAYCSKLTTINFAGNINEWNTITKGSDWNNGCSQLNLIQCSDGNAQN